MFQNPIVLWIISGSAKLGTSVLTYLGNDAEFPGPVTLLDTVLLLC